MNNRPRRLLRFLVIAAILGFAVLVAIALVSSKPPPEKKAETRTKLLVEAAPVEIVTVDFAVQSQGTLQPRTETALSAEVSGTIVEVTEQFVPGGLFKKGEVLLRIDPTNYTVAVEQAKALLTQRQIEYDGAVKLKESGYQADASVASAAAALASARAGLTRAQRDLQRTYIRLPYDGMVKSKEVDLGQFVNPGTRLGVTFATDYAEVRLPLTDQDLAFVNLPGPTDNAGPAVLLQASRKGQPYTWEAQITRTEGVIDEKTRVTYAVARLDDPYGLKNGGVPLPVGSFVTAFINGKTLENVMRVPRTVLRGRNELLFVDKDSRLRLRNVDILRTDQDYAYLSGGVVPGEQVVLTAIESPVNGTEVRVDNDATGLAEAGETVPADESGGAAN